MIPSPFSPVNSVVFSPQVRPQPPTKSFLVNICQMADAADPSTWRLWSHNPNAPMIPYYQYVDEKVIFAGTRIGSILYGTCKTPPSPPPHLSTRAHSVRSVILGIVVVLFFKCTVALLKPTHLRGDGVKWGLVSYTVVMFSFATVFTVTSLTAQSNSYIDNRGLKVTYENEPLVPSAYGPYAYKAVPSCPTALEFTSDLVFLFNYWLADGFLVSSSFCAVFTRSDV